MNTKRLINNIILVLDASSSMTHLKTTVEKVIKNLHGPMVGKEQVSRVSIYTFGSDVKRHMHLRHPDALLDFTFNPYGMTALIDGAYQSITEHKNVLSGDFEDNTFLLYLITDGGENHSSHRPEQLRSLISSLDDRWTIAALVPDLQGVHYTKMCGIPAGNIEVWDVNSSRGFEDMGRRVEQTLDNYRTMRTSGKTSSSRLFVDVSDLSVGDVSASLTEDNRMHCFTIKDGDSLVVRDYYEALMNRPYDKGNLYYQLTKPESVSASKKIAIRNTVTDVIYTGDNARSTLGLPSGDVKIKPGDLGDWEIYVQSTSVNRKLSVGQNVLIYS